MEKLLDSISGFVDSKLRNPFINTFIIAWTAFNWKPILFFIFSKTTAENKIWFITLRYSDTLQILIYPLLSTFAALIFVPLFLAGIEYVVKFITMFRLNIEGDLAKKKNTVEDQVLAARKISDVNEHISNLEEQIKEYESDLNAERAEIQEQSKRHSEQLKALNDNFSSIIEEHASSYEAIMKEKLNLQDELGKCQDFNISAYAEKLKLQQERATFETEANNNYLEAIQSNAKYTLLQRNLKNIDRSDKLFVFADGQKIIETYNDNNEIMYLQSSDGSYIDPDAFLKKINTVFFDEYYLGKNNLRLLTFDDLPDNLKIVNFLPRD